MKAPNGVLLVAKPVGPTSHDVVQAVRRAFGIKKVGHAGTLDPFASGLLLLLLGPATRLSEYLLGLDKRYEAKAILGVETSTHDPEGEVVAECHDLAAVTRVAVEQILAGFRGEILQEPPIFSSKKIRGEAAHRRARRGEEVELKRVPVTIHEISLSSFSPPELAFSVRCSAGTYIRALGRDLGRSLGVGAHLTQLERTGIGGFSLEDALPLSSLVEAKDEVLRRLVTPARALGHLPEVSVDQPEALRIRQGQSLPSLVETVPEGRPIRILQAGELLAIGVRVGDRIQPRKVLGQ
jgi:tRNA pseudouridine55 synthase